MSRSTAQFNVRPGVGGVPPIVKTSRNTRWFSTRLLTDGSTFSVEVAKGIVYCPLGYSRNAGGYDAPMESHVVSPADLTLTTAPEQCIIVRVPYVAGHVNTEGDPLYGLFDATLQDNDDWSAAIGYTVKADDVGETSLYGVTHKALWMVLDAAPSILRVDAADVEATDFILADVTYADGNYELFSRHDGAIFVFPPVWITNHEENW